MRDEQEQHYLELFNKHGDDPQALSYRDGPTQIERFHRLSLAFADMKEPFSVHEVGCGLGHYGDYLKRHHPLATYSGSDIIETFVDHCRERFPDDTFHHRDLVADNVAERYDWVMLSGLFNLKLAQPRDVWQDFVWQMLTEMYRLCRHGIGCNFVTSYVDEGRERSEIFYQDPRTLIDFATRHLSRHVEYDGAGPLYDYTVRIYRPEHIRRDYADAAFDHYFPATDGS
ncbi:MAG: class I SAM-dependent methyltransferase [Acidobacteriota bacterium]|nr:class I SAM-dependent methyltransferase [Acidobacteriota bacterium]